MYKKYVARLNELKDSDIFREFSSVENVENFIKTSNIQDKLIEEISTTLIIEGIERKLAVLNLSNSFRRIFSRIKRK